MHAALPDQLLVIALSTVLLSYMQPNKKRKRETGKQPNQCIMLKASRCLPYQPHTDIGTCLIDDCLIVVLLTMLCLAWVLWLLQP